MRQCRHCVPSAFRFVFGRFYHMPGWKTMVSTKDARSREQREADRKARQIDKLPRPQALHDFQYPYEKTVLSDSMFQYPVYENDLDTPHLFNLTPPPDFFVYWNVSDFERTAYPPVPRDDHRLLSPSSDSVAWQQHRQRSLKYLRKHGILPNYLPHIRQDVNLSVVYPGTYATRARRCEETGEPLPPPPPVTELTRRNFWMTAHCGNYVELTDLQHPPSIFFLEAGECRHDVAARDASSPSESEAQASYYTLVIASPDYPYRVPADVDGRTKRGFFLNYMVANLRGDCEAASVSEQQMENGKGEENGEGAIKHASSLPKKGDIVAPYIPPLPTEDAGTTRHICMLFRQSRRVEGVAAVFEDTATDFVSRCNFRLHAPDHEDSTASAKILRAVEQALLPNPSAVTFFQTKWDIQVQEFYESRGLPEPAAPIDEEIENILTYHAKRPSELRVRARHRPDGSTNIGDDPNFWAQVEPTRVMDGSMQRLWSRRTALGRNGVPLTFIR
ncbi:hypothetical protein ERJ75_001827500 [Trypanosoma vivax]|uniref:Phosphatidylethanolamine-binding protein n=1 Tax=Trypanosoma vivax (strain Y486) TaxID=1055687 RepID=G0U912_TRYVY|nr:hypothetical protein TRVL_02368 [Trypanosoma vivax]KAH8603374.1 hypothetical protein ERJ75_001827500 [Trypanosoma vivax]CCC54095.1 conserved hypothetical protein [Trypanosoma vivax Y486]